jgi:hypothetical protein
VFLLSERPAAIFWMSTTMQVECRFGDMFGVKWTVQTLSTVSFSGSHVEVELNIGMSHSNVLQ